MNITHAYVWPDGFWCWASEFDEVSSSRSDDFQEIHLPEWADEDDMDSIAEIIQRDGACDIVKFFGLES